MKTRETKTLRIKHACDLILSRYDDTSLGLHSIISSDTIENASLNHEDGEFQCWDASVMFVEGGVKIWGADGPSGGKHYYVELFVPQHLIQSIKTEVA